jgi:Papain family cysteine protease
MQLEFGKNVKLSEQEAMECTNGCHGGNAAQVFSYMNEKGGAAAEDDDKYDFKNIKQCGTSTPRVPHTMVYAMGVAYSDDHPTEYCMRWAVVNRGPIYVGFKVYSNFHNVRKEIYQSASGAVLGYL